MNRDVDTFVNGMGLVPLAVCGCGCTFALLFPPGTSDDVMREALAFVDSFALADDDSIVGRYRTNVGRSLN